MTKTEARKAIEREIEKPGAVEEYESVEHLEKAAVLKGMKRLSAKGYRVVSFGWSNGFQGGWYALMARVRIASYEVLDRLTRAV